MQLPNHFYEHNLTQIDGLWTQASIEVYMLKPYAEPVWSYVVTVMLACIVIFYDNTYRSMSDSKI